MVGMLGICITAEECDAQEGGSAAGNCASGFGVCCFTMISDPATAITNVSSRLLFTTVIIGIEVDLVLF